MAFGRSENQKRIDRERQTLLNLIQSWLEVPMVVLAFLWLAIFLIEVIWGLHPLLTAIGYIIWGFFVLEFILGISLAPRKRTYLKHNWLKAISLPIPALRIFRIFYILRFVRIVRISRGLQMIRLLSSVNRGMRALRTSMRRRGFGYIVALTVIVALTGAAGIYSFERDAPDGSELDSYGMSLWWTAMIMTSIGSEFWPQTGAGRILCFILALYSLGVFGYITATLATFFVGQDAERDDAELASAKDIAKLRVEISELRKELREDRKS